MRILENQWFFQPKWVRPYLYPPPNPKIPLVGTPARANDPYNESGKPKRPHFGNWIFPDDEEIYRS